MRGILKTVLLSVKPNFAELILSGTKRFEFRKVPFASEVHKVVIYASAPVKQIVCLFKLKNMTAGHPKSLWRKFKPAAGIGHKEFFAYFGSNSVGYALGIGTVTELRSPVDPQDLWPDFTPPQNFKYISSNELDQILDFA